MESADVSAALYGKRHIHVSEDLQQELYVLYKHVFVQKSKTNNEMLVSLVLYVRQTLCTPLFLRPSLHLLSRVLNEAGLGKVPIDVEDHRRRKYIARQYDTDIQPTLASTALRMTIGMYALLNAMAVGAFFVEVGSNVWIKRHKCTHG